MWRRRSVGCQKWRQKGISLTDMNRIHECLHLVEANVEAAHFQVVYDKFSSVLPRKLEEAGWEEALVGEKVEIHEK